MTQGAGGSSEKAEQAQEALQSLGDFHQGSWKGKTTSFTVTADVAAGIVQKKFFPNYQVDVKLSCGDDGKLSLSEVYSWQDKDFFASTRSVPIAAASVDIDAVDASYSLHQYGVNNEDNSGDQRKQQQYTLPADLIGTNKPAVFTVEHALAVSDDERVRLWALYGDKEELIRVVVAEETRRDSAPPIMEGAASTLTAADLMELKTDVDRIVDKIAGNMPAVSTPNAKNKDTNNPPTLTELQQQDRLRRSQESWSVASKSSSKSDDRGPPLTRYPISLLELTSGVWLGDSIIRDYPTVPGQFSSNAQSGKGFGNTPGISNSKLPPFASWAIGVQKVAREWLWDFGGAIRENNEAGKSMGAQMEPSMSQSMAGAVCENQSLSRRIPKEERMVYIDWNKDNQVGFLLGSVSIQVCSIVAAYDVDCNSSCGLKMCYL
jgi:hypothetical protein